MTGKKPMIAACVRLVTLALLALGSAPALAATNHINPELVSEVAAPAPGSMITVAVNMRTEAGWHGYWKNPGEAGLAPQFAWTLPRGARISDSAYPVPGVLSVAGLVNYVFIADHALLFRLTLPPGLAPGTPLPIRAKATWLACTDKVCVPESGNLALDLHFGDGAVSAAPRFDAWRAALPTPLDAKVTFERRAGRLRFAIPFPAGADPGTPHFFPDGDGMIADAAPQSFTRTGDTLIADLAVPPDSATAPPSGVLAIGGGRGLAFAAVPGPVPPPGSPLILAAPLPVPANIWATTLVALGGAILGGLILNIMPCVFPILSLKALSLAKGGSNARRDALGYTLGAVLVCTALGGLILILRAWGSSVGWAFQLQDPRVITALIILVSLIALNLAGLFELPSVGTRLAATNNVATGALAAFIATPCTGPFMGAALGAALVLPPLAALAVFAGLGFGLALPFLLLGFVPALRGALPRPGAWMVTLRHLLSIPMFATALGLVWLLGRQAGSDALTIGLAAAIASGLILWWVGLRQARGRAGLTFGLIISLAVTTLAIVRLPTAPSSAPAVTDNALHAEPFTEARLATLRAHGRPVFVYFTADWCLTCKVNERVAIDQQTVAAAFASKNIATLVGDWTRADPAIGRFLTAQGRSGVPLYLFYPAGAASPHVLPQILTPGMLTAL